MSGAFESDQFALQVIVSGSYTDDGTGDGRTYRVETTVIRLNHVALNAWLSSEMLNVRECYQDGPAGDAEWKAHKAEYAAKRKAVKGWILEALGFKSDKGVSITQALSEVFTVVHIYEIQ